MKTGGFNPGIEDGRVEVPAENRAEEGSSSERHRELGQDRVRFTVPDDFDTPLPEEIQRSFED